MNSGWEMLKSDFADHLMSKISRLISDHSNASESPIEGLMCHALMAFGFACHKTMPLIGSMEPGNSQARWAIFQQHQIGKYRVDFLLMDRLAQCEVVIECDGHDFHERTKEQAQRDRKRDRELQARGYLVLRYTGSEIYRDPYGCAADVQEKALAFRGMLPALAGNTIDGATPPA